MSAKAFILIETAVGKNREVVTEIRNIEGVKSVDTVTGPYDVIAIVEADSLNAIGDIVTGNIHPVTGISRTVTCLAIKSE
jgi:DNA-binding Lrp family transcriptional regulator